MSVATARQPFLEHIQELRGRLVWSVIALLIGTTIGYYIKDHLLTWLVAPLGQTLYYTSPGGGFALIIQICLGFGVIFAVPVIIFHLIRFLSPILPSYSLRLLVIILLSSCTLVALGVTFAYLVSLPAALYFLSEFSNEQVQALISTDTYMSFVTLYLAGFAVLFQLPLLLLIINGVTPLPPKKLLGGTRWVVLGSFVAAAIITPTPDPFNQTIMAGPIIVLYLLSIGLIKLVNSRRKIWLITGHPKLGSLDISQVNIVGRQKASYEDKAGEYCFWKVASERSGSTFVTFLHQGAHKFVEMDGSENPSNLQIGHTLKA